MATEVVGAMEKVAGVLAVIKDSVVITVRSARVFRAESRAGSSRGDIRLTVEIGNLGCEKGAGDMKKPLGFIPTFREVLSVPYSAFRAISFTFQTCLVIQ